ncbi:MAG: hypothetical protein ACYS4W_15255 [Planctomycetota bacterium]|jgi:hypothetical protein
MTQDEQYLKLLSIFHYVVGGLTALFSCLPLLHIAMGIAMLCGAFDSKGGPPKVFGLLFIVFPAVVMLCGWALSVCIVIAGRKLAQRKARIYCLVVAALECILMPFGTVLGVFTIVVLMKDSVQQLFSANQPTPPTT